MTGQASPGDEGASKPRTSWWLLTVVAVALAIFALNVLIPIELLAWVFTAAVGLFGAAHMLDRIGALSPGIFDGTVYLASAILILSATLATCVTLWNLVRRLAGGTKPPPFLLRWPWFVIGAALVIGCRVLVPSDLTRSQQPVLAGGFVLATAVWAVLYAANLLFAFGKGGLSLSWRIARASPFGAGMLTIACLGSTALVMMLGAVAEELQSRAGTLSAPRSALRCDSLSVECSRQFLLASSTTGALPSAASATSRTQSFRDCLESRYQDTSLLDRARRIAASIVGEADAPDVVHATLLNVCLHSERYDDFEQFFLRSVKYGSLKWLRRVRACPLDLEPEPVCELRPDDQYVRSEAQHALQKSLCSLGEEHRQVLFMRYFDDMSELEISQRLGIEYAAARKRVQRARDKLEIDFLQRCR